ncbi:MAG: hypothetical protein LLG14_23950 [Nocardiaceae bacterium]|nr:hypothetical protein [Nocardiaceae bacterium]
MTSTLHYTATTCGGSPVELRLGAPLPRQLASAAADLSWDQFLAEYSPTGPIRLGRLAQAMDCPAEFHATISVGDRIQTHRVAAHGPIAAVTSALYAIGIPVEVLSFHQRACRGEVATFVRYDHDGRDRWAFAVAGEGDDSAVRALIAAANRIAG